jgi:hypothetical protein
MGSFRASRDPVVTSRGSLRLSSSDIETKRLELSVRGVTRVLYRDAALCLRTLSRLLRTGIGTLCEWSEAPSSMSEVEVEAIAIEPGRRGSQLVRA